MGGHKVTVENSLWKNKVPCLATIIQPSLVAVYNPVNPLYKCVFWYVIYDSKTFASLVLCCKLITTGALYY